MERSSGSRKTASNLSESVHQHINMYAFGAVAISLVAFTQPSGARIVYTPTHVKVDSPYDLNLNRDGTTDFTIQQNHFHHSCIRGPFDQDLLTVTAAQGNGEVGSNQNRFAYVAALDRGVTIGPRQGFISDFGATMAEVYSGYVGGWEHCRYVHSTDGYWVNVSNRYLGLEFQIKGKTHYGWARLSVQVGYVYIHATLTGYAYETTAGKSIKAGQTEGAADERDEEGFDPAASVTSPITDTRQPASLGMLALGAQGPAVTAEGVVSLYMRKQLGSAIAKGEDHEIRKTDFGNGVTRRAGHPSFVGRAGTSHQASQVQSRRHRYSRRAKFLVQLVWRPQRPPEQ